MLKRRSNIPGFQEGGANVDPVSGNDVPVGSLPEEVRDDIDAKLSPGEFVIPADVVRFIGLERLMKMRDEAKKGLQRMSEIGQMGNADEVGEESNSTYEDEGFESEIDDILEEIEAEENGRDVNEQTEVMMAQGGFMKSGTDLTKAPKNPVFDVRYYKNDEGSVMYITHINGKPMTPIPEGYKAVTQEEAQKVGQKAEEAAKAAQASQQQESSYDPGEANRALGIDPTGEFFDKETAAEKEARMGRVAGFIEKGVKAISPFGMLPTLAQKAAGLFADQTRPTPAPVTDALARTPTQIAAGTTAGAGSMMEAVASDAYREAIDLGLSEASASRAAANALSLYNSGAANESSAISVSVRDELDRVTGGSSLGVDALGGSPYSSSSSTVSPPSTATASAVSEKGSITQRDISDFDPGKDRSGSYDYGGSSYSGGFGTGTDFGEQDYGSFLAKGGLVNKRQYPAKKKRGKGIAAAKT